jgi:hypothetical protein
MVRLQAHLSDDPGRRGNSDWRAAEADASFGCQNHDESLMNHYGSAYEKTKRRANTLVAGRLLPESMKAASKATIQ